MSSGTIPPLGENPKIVKSWWGGLGNNQRLGLLADHPERIGELDGIPVAIRDRANRCDLDTIIDAAEQRLHQPSDLPLDDVARQVRERVRYVIENRVSLFGLQILKKWIERTPPVEGLAYHLIDFDVDGEGKAVVALGDPDNADNVSVFVPGSFAAVDEDLDDYARMDAMAVDTAARDHAAKTAVVRWLGYDAPNSIVPDAADPRMAEDTAVDLDRFVTGLRVTHDASRSRLTVIGHSYGTVVIGVADREHRLDADALVFIGSPGVGVDSAADLSVGAQNVWATVAPGDLIEETPPHLLGIAPTRPEFNARTFSCDDTGKPPWWLMIFGVPRDMIKAHNGYWDPGNVARENIASIVVGDLAAVKPART